MFCENGRNNVLTRTLTAKLSSTKIIENIAKRVFEPQNEKIKPTFNETDCKQYFRTILSEKNYHKTFDPPSWVKKLNEPTIKFNIDTPSYAEITKIIMKMKSPALACLNDAMSIIEFKKCPTLRSHLVKITVLAH